MALRHGQLTVVAGSNTSLTAGSSGTADPYQIPLETTVQNMQCKVALQVFIWERRATI